MFLRRFGWSQLKVHIPVILLFLLLCQGRVCQVEGDLLSAKLCITSQPALKSVVWHNKFGSSDKLWTNVVVKKYTLDTPRHPSDTSQTPPETTCIYFQTTPEAFMHATLTICIYFWRELVPSYISEHCCLHTTMFLLTPAVTGNKWQVKCNLSDPRTKFLLTQAMTVKGWLTHLPTDRIPDSPF